MTMRFNEPPRRDASDSDHRADDASQASLGASQEDSGVWRALSRKPAVAVISEYSTERPPWPELVRMVRAQVRSLVGQTRDLEDLTQAALEQVVKSIDRFEGRCELSTYTYRIASRVVMNHWRSLRRYLKRFVLGAEDVPEPEAEVEEKPVQLLERQRAARLHHHLDKLSATLRVVVVLADLEELPASRIAEIVDCPEPTVRSRLARGRADLARRLAKDPLFAEDVERQGGD